MPDSTKSFGSCLLEQTGAVATLIFNRPDKMNAFSPDLFHGLEAAYADIVSNDSIRALIITGAGDHFSAGGDVEQDIDPLRTKTVNEFRDYFQPLAELYRGIYRLDKPTIAAINGFALGAGMELTLMCDIRIASETAQMGEFFIKMGLVPETGMCMLPKIVGPGMAKKICFTGDLVSAEEALRIGLVEQVVKKEELMPIAEKLGRRLARSPASIKLIKQAINEHGELPLELTLNAATTLQFQATRTRDHEEAVKAFLEKRRANFTGE